MPTQEEMQAIAKYRANLEWIETHADYVPTDEEMIALAEYVANSSFHISHQLKKEN